MPLAQTRRPKWAWTFRDRGIRRLRTRNDTDYLLSSPETAHRILSALEDARAGRGMMTFSSVEELRAALRRAEGE
jgi:hypothetical protein